VDTVKYKLIYGIVQNSTGFILILRKFLHLFTSDSSASQQQYGIAPIHLIKRLNWINGPPAGVVARAIFPRPSTSQDSFSLVLPTNEKQYLRDEENIENYENEENKRRFSREIVD